MKKFKVMLSVFMVLVIISISVAPTFAVIAPEDSASSEISWVDKIDDKLKTVIEESTSNDTIKVALWLSDVDEEERSQEVSSKIRLAEKKDELSTDIVYGNDFTISRNTQLSSEYLSQQAQTLVEIKRDVEKELHTENNTNVLNTLSSVYDIDSEPIFVSNYAPFIIMDMTKDEISNIAHNQSIENIYLYEPVTIVEENDLVVASTSGSNSYPYGVWQENTNIDTLRDVFGYTGYGVNIGLIQNHIPDFNHSSLSSEMQTKLNELFSYSETNNLLHYLSSGSDNFSELDHTHYMLSILTGFTDDYSGIAPHADVYCDEFSPITGYYGPIENLIDAGVNVICAAIAMGSCESRYDYNAQFLDYVISKDDVTICIATGNGNSVDDYEVHNGAMAYNVIASGNIDDKNTNTLEDDVIKSSSRYSTVENTAYKPDVCAPGNRAGTYSHDWMDTSQGGGTCAATGINTGICALLMQVDPSLKTNPMLLKSILMASTCELNNMQDVYSVSTSINPALLRKYASGMVDAYKAYDLIMNSQYSSFDTYEMSISRPLTVLQREVNQSKDIYLSLNWEQWVTKSGNSYNVLNDFQHTLSLYDPDGVLVAVSNYQYDKKQFIRYKPLQAGTYTIKINRTYTNAPAYYPKFAIAYCIK